MEESEMWDRLRVMQEGFTCEYVLYNYLHLIRALLLQLAIKRWEIAGPQVCQLRIKAL